jgi:hypothetical protein
MLAKSSGQWSVASEQQIWSVVISDCHTSNFVEARASSPVLYLTDH